MPYVLQLYYTTYNELKNYPKTIDYADKLVALGDKVRRRNAPASVSTPVRSHSTTHLATRLLTRQIS